MHFNHLFLSFILFILVSSFGTSAASFKLDKTRIVLDESNRREELRIYNDSNILQSFKVTLIEMTMTEEGTLVESPDYEHSAKPYIRIGPRISRDVAPNSFQKVRIIKRETPTTNEYRSHLLVESLTPDPISQVEGVFVRPNVKYVIPVFVNRDVSSNQLVFGDIQYANNEAVLSLYREGSGSVSGNIAILDIDNNELFRANQISIYPELTKRFLKTSLLESDVVGKHLTLIFEDPMQDNKIVLQKTIQL